MKKSIALLQMLQSNSIFFQLFLHICWRNSAPNGSFVIKQIYYQTRFTDKMQTRAYTIDDLVGTCGGYIGLFLGYAVVQLPKLIEVLYHTIKKQLK